MTTKKQKSAVRFCEKQLNITFEGNINNYSEVSSFLEKYLEEVKYTCMEITCEYESYIQDLD